MGRMPWVAYLWPGLPQMYRQGSWSALALAVGFAALVNLALAASLLWSELFAAGVRNAVWMAVVLLWGGSAGLAYWWDRRYPTPFRGSAAEDAFPEALDHYLKGNWFEAEHVLRGLLAENPRDLEAGLLLATLFRRTGRPREAETELNRLERYQGSEKWALEIGRERQLLHEARSESPPESEQETGAVLAGPSATMVDAA